MENNGASKIGCRGNNRLKIIDPNDFYGYPSSMNHPVQNEDLNISVKLTTYRKARTVLTKTEDVSTTESTNTIRLNFIEGSNVNGKRVLTTKYTDLTTVFEQGTINTETLGITNIDIDFNSSYAPQITIDFVDVRGSSIFQNESDISNTDINNPYAAFFQLPYPLFELEIKGYYGQPVTYCLHMIKFSSKFNSQTGNFEIKCNFIGYTYAMLSDMLVGFLKAIPFTTIGGKKFEEYNSDRDKDKPILNLVDLKIKVNQINTAIEKIAAQSDSSKGINSFSQGRDLLTQIQSAYITFASISLKKKSDDDFSYRFVVTDEKDLTSDQQQIYQSLDTEVRKLIKSYNDLNFQGLSLNENDFLPVNYIPNITRPLLLPSSTEPLETSKTGKELEDFKHDALYYLDNYIEATTDDYKFRFYDLRKQSDLLEKQKTLLDKNLDDSNRSLANEIKDKISVELGFDPTVRNIIEIFTSLIEVFIETIYQVSQEAESNEIRTAELDKVFNNFNNDLPDAQVKAKKYYPWPDYREKDEKTGSYVDKYIGTCTAIDKKLEIDEIKFIENLLQAFLTANELEKKADALLAGEEVNWFPANPIDTRLFQEDGKSPYSRIEMNSLPAVQRLMLIRAMIFLGYTNDEKYLTTEEIQTMAKLEANAIASAAQPTIKNVLKNITYDKIKDVTGVINGLTRHVVSDVNNTYQYTYLFSNAHNTKVNPYVLPISSDLNDTTIGGTNETKTFTSTQSVMVSSGGGIPGASTGPTYQTTSTTYNPYTIDSGSYDNEVTRNMLKELSTTQNILTNYSSAKVTSVNNRKLIDGGVYMKIFTPAEFNTSAQLIDTSVKTDSMINLQNLKDDKITEAGFNCFGGSYGIQEFVNMDFGDGMDKLPLMYVFYENNLVDGIGKNGLAFTRAKTGGKKPTSSIYDFNKTAGKTRIINLGDNLLSRNDLYFGVGDVQLHSNVAKNRELFNELSIAPMDVSYPYIEQGFIQGTNYSLSDKGDFSFSLFGSKWYYLQDQSHCTLADNTTITAEKNTKALIFLNTLPFNRDFNGKLLNDNDPFGLSEIKHLFDIRGGFIHAPRLWCAYVGGVIWWLSDEDPILDGNNNIIGGGRGKKDPITWQKSCKGDYVTGEFEGFTPPDANQYLPIILELTETNGQIVDYPDIRDSDIILNLPNQVKEEFKRMFFDFVNATGDYVSFDSLREKLEINKNASSNLFCQHVTKITKTNNQTYGFGGTGLVIDDGNDKFSISNSTLTNYFSNVDQYKIVSPMINADDDKDVTFRDALFLELDDKSEAVTRLINALKDEVIIANTGYHIWRGPYTGNFGDTGSLITDLRHKISVSNANFDEYFKTLTNELTTVVSAYTTTAEKDATLNEIFDTSNLNDIKLMLYRNCKNIYDKWLGGVTDPNNIIFQCGNDNKDTSNRNVGDLAMAKRQDRTKARLIDSFRFVNRSFRDIGDELFINPLPLVSKLDDFPNTSAYEIISGLLGDNKFDFIALPTFINFYDDKVLETMFKPISMYEEPIKSCGPSFVCVYTGQKSKNLDLKDSNANYSNDGFDIRCSNGNLDPSIPTDYGNPLADVSVKGTKLEKPYEDPVPVFVVKYGQQNQNLFKDITLDQNEFSETEESIKIVQDISMKGAESNVTIGGQNMYNVYSVRSYNAEVEMMGNAMVQPMMYFQLDNIPMFHGAYMITRVKHSIKPNNMSTNFTGVRIRAAETPIIDVTDAYMALIETLNVAGAGTSGGGTISGSFPPIVATIIDNGASNGDIEAGTGNIKLKVIPKIDKVGNEKTGEGNGLDSMLSEAADSLVEMLKAFVIEAEKQGFPTIDGNYITISSLFRTIAKQNELWDDSNKDGSVARPGRSNHGWGIAVDLKMICQKDCSYKNRSNKTIAIKAGEYFPIDVTSKTVGFNITYNPSLKWFLDNGYKYGFIIPYELRVKGNFVQEFWHFEYHGTSAKCLMSKHPTVGSYTPTINRDYKPIVINPKGIDGKPVVFDGKNCEYITINNVGDGYDSGKQINPSLIYAELKKVLGYDDQAIAGVMGNLYQESRFNPTATNVSGGDYGLAQWKVRKPNLLKWLSDNKLDKTSYTAQIQFLKHELDTVFKYTNANLKTNKNCEDSTKIFYITFEAGNLGEVGFNDTKVNKRLEEMKLVDNTYIKRVSFAKQFSAMIKSKKFYFPK